MRAAVILAGGLSARFGTDKALELLSGLPLVSWVAAQAKREVDDVIITIGASQDISRYLRVLPPKVKVIVDKVALRNPMIGILTGLEATSSQYAVILTCDVPFVSATVIRHLFERAIGYDAAIPKWPNGNLEPLQAVYKVESTLRAVRQTLAAREQRVVHMIKRLQRVAYISTEHLKRFDGKLLTFFNINSREDLKVATRILRDMETV
jgi:molybdopterin-guanine dinucleotide biosynthesis protein A